jgi:serine phosphatase RsbU (regulator of sigma subunit)
MKLINTILNFGLSRKLNSREERLLKYCNVTLLIVLCFVLINTIVFIAFGNPKDSKLLVVYFVHFMLIAASLFFNAQKKYFLAKVNFALVAIVFVSYYAIAFGQIGYNYLFIPMIAFLIFNLFDIKEKIPMWVLVTLASLSYLVVLYLNRIGFDANINIDTSFQEMQGPTSLLGYLALTIVFGFYNYKLVVKTENRLSEEKKEVELQKEVIEKVNNEIRDSIMYAKRIQLAILPNKKLINSHLKESFILYKPKDIVAGDFYWLEVTKDSVFFAVADCTGHGVPGAMVSVICNGGLNRSVREFGLTDPGNILDQTRALVLQEFEKSEEEVKDGMDIALCKLEGTTLSYSGANNPLWIIRNEEFLETKADKQPIGKHEASTPFTTHTVELEKGDTIYIFSDGFPDQFGGEKGKKYKSGNFKKFLVSIQEHPMEKQRELLNTEFESWKGKLEQIDDVCVIGVKI